MLVDIFRESAEAWARASSTQIMVSIAIGVIILHAFVSAGNLCQRYAARKWLPRWMESDSLPRRSLWQSLADAIQSPGGATDPDVVTSPRRTYRILEHLAVGDLCDVHIAISQRRPFIFKTPRTSGCDRLLAKEQKVLRDLHATSDGDRYSEYFPVPCESFCAGDHLISVLTWRDGLVSSEAIRRRYSRGIDARHVSWMFNRTLEALGFVHKIGWVHGAVLPPHLMFHARNHGLQLIGWTHAERMNTPLRIVSQTFKSWYPPECAGREPATAATDIYLAVKSMIWLSGGDPIAGTPPDEMPLEMQSFLSDCLSHRPGEAWTLRDRFRVLLEDLYGPPKFCHLTMS